jgi:uncharacterized protein with GYD domain
MLFCITAQYTPQALNSMLDDTETNRMEAVKQLLEAAGAELISMYSMAAEGPGALVIFDTPDPDMAPSIAGVVVAGGGVQNLKLTRLWSPDEIATVREKGRQIRGSYKVPGK